MKATEGVVHSDYARLHPFVLVFPLGQIVESFIDS